MQVEQPRNTGGCKRFKQFFATVCMGGISLGASIVWTSPVLPQLIVSEDLNTTTQHEASLQLTIEEGSWVGSTMAIGALAAAVPSGYLADIFGVKKLVIAVTIPAILFSVFAILATDVYMLCFARFLSGIATGGSSVLAPMYISEISDVALRGTLGSFFEFLIYVGISTTAAFGAYVDYITLTFIHGLIPVVLGFCFLFMPDNPAHIMKGRNKEKARLKAGNALRFFRSKTTNIDEELDHIQEQIDVKRKSNASLGDLMKSKATLRGLVASVGLTVYQQLCGIDGVTFYTVTIFQIADASLDAYTSSIIVALSQLTSAMFLLFIIEKAGRKTFIYISCWGMVFSLVVLGLFFHFKSLGISFPGMNWLPVTSLFVYIWTFAMGLGPVPWMINGELFSQDVKGIANGITITMNWLFLFIVTKMFPIMLLDVGPHYTFYTFAGFMVSCVVFTKYFVPETRGKTLKEIQNELQT